MCEVIYELRFVKIEKACIQTLGLAVDDVEDLHLLALGESDKAHEGEHDWKVANVPKSVLAVHLCQYALSSRIDLESNALAFAFYDAPRGFIVRPYVQGKRDRRTTRPSDITPEVEAVPFVERTLIASPGRLIQDVRGT